MSWNYLTFRDTMPPSSMSAARHRWFFGKRFDVVLVFVLGVFAVTAAPARAQDNTQRAKELFQQGSTLFNLGDFDKAVEAWQAGYKEKPDPTFLYNIGQAYRLKGDTQKALFFYRGYLRNAPKGAFRAEVEAKIAALQKGSDAKATPPPATAPPVSTAPAAPPPVAPAPTSVAPPPVETPPLPEPMSAPSPNPGEPGPAAPPPSAAAPAGEGRNRPIDIQVALGFDKFTSGVNVTGGVPSQLALELAGGYTFGAADAPVRFRLGAFFGSTTLTEKVPTTSSNKLGFASALLEPSVRIRVVPRRVALTFGVGLGVLGVSNLKTNSVVLAKGRAAAVTGTIPLFESRFSAGLQVQLSPAWMLTASPAFSVSPKGEAFYGSLGRFELMFGVGTMF